MCVNMPTSSFSSSIHIAVPESARCFCAYGPQRTNTCQIGHHNSVWRCCLAKHEEKQQTSSQISVAPVRTPTAFGFYMCFSPWERQHAIAHRDARRLRRSPAFLVRWHGRALPVHLLTCCLRSRCASTRVELPSGGETAAAPSAPPCIWGRVTPTHCNPCCASPLRSVTPVAAASPSVEVLHALRLARPP